MTYALDPEIEAVVVAFAEAIGEVKVPALDDVQAQRDNADITLTYLDKFVPPAPNVRTTSFEAIADDGTGIEVRWYAKADSSPGSAVVYAHGGGMILANVDYYNAWVAWYVERTGIPFLSVEYRRAPEVKGTTPMRDTFAALRWLIEHAAELGVDPARIVLMGDSAGGGIMAGVSILARDNGIAIAHQVLIYPMLDDRADPQPALADFATWTYDDNYTGWHALLDENIGGDDVSPIAAPARLTDCAGLPPAYIEVGDLDIFRDEDIAYAQKLSRAQVQVEFHLHTGAPHGFDRFAPTSALAQRAFDDRIRVLKSV
ncbi:MAG TPA: alpha/beta hydrolase [Pseudonocardiaceae bacterium]|jgi:acetyl esterase/lipase|nr:alpha/beta hydrolase [Pseudonocardiaceae bacterium]